MKVTREVLQIYENRVQGMRKKVEDVPKRSYEPKDDGHIANKEEREKKMINFGKFLACIVID